MHVSGDEACRWLGVDRAQLPSAYTLIDQLRYKARELFKREHLSDLWVFLYGYRFGMIIHNINNNIYEYSFECFQDWLEHRLGAGKESWYKTLLMKAG